jgi:hypothetical protein
MAPPLASLALLLFLCRPAHAYVDGGTGSMILQTLLAGFGGLAVFLRLKWKSLFKKKNGAGSEPPSDGK